MNPQEDERSRRLIRVAVATVLLGLGTVACTVAGATPQARSPSMTPSSSWATGVRGWREIPQGGWLLGDASGRRDNGHDAKDDGQCA